MTLVIYISTIFMLIPTLVRADGVVCPGIVDHVLVEEGHDQPYPDLIPPDVGAYGETSQQEWNYLSNGSDDVPVTIHCLPNEKEDVETDILLPNYITKCVFLEGNFSCK